MFGRVPFNKGGEKMPQPLRAGAGFVANCLPAQRVAETDETLTVEEISGGSVQQNTTLTSDVTYTMPTAVLILAEFTGMDVGDCFSFMVKNAQAGAFDVLLVVGTGITKIGANNLLETAPKSTNVFHLVKTGAATMDLF